LIIKFIAPCQKATSDKYHQSPMADTLPTSDLPGYFEGVDDRMSTDSYPFQIPFDHTDNADGLSKWDNFMDLDALDAFDPEDEGQVFMFNNARSSDDSRESNKASQDVDRAKVHLSSHRGSTSSSSSARSGCSNSPNRLSTNPTPVDGSPHRWFDGSEDCENPFEGPGGSDNSFKTFDAQDDLSRYINLSGSPNSSESPVTHEPSPDFHTPDGTMSQGRANKRRKAQPKKLKVSYFDSNC
jgi:hypothetical protein